MKRHIRILLVLAVLFPVGEASAKTAKAKKLTDAIVEPLYATSTAASGSGARPPLPYSKAAHSTSSRATTPTPTSATSPQPGMIPSRPVTLNSQLSILN